MKKLLLIFLLFVVPLQATWAGADAYCQKVQDPFIMLCYDSAQEIHVGANSDEDESTSTTVRANHGVHSCHVCGVPLIGVSHTDSLFPSSNFTYQVVETRHPLAMISHRPERPQWSDVA